MNSSIKVTRKDKLGKRLRLEDFEALCAELAKWRTDRNNLTLNRKKGSGNVLGFVKGLRLSARLIYAVRKSLSGTSLGVDWGHLLNPDEDSLSPECDIIVHRGEFIQEWDGTKNPVMNFKFIKCDQAIAVISCKSFAKSIDPSYCLLLKPYIDNILLFAECCTPGSKDALQERAKKAGYKGFWYLYTFDDKTSEIIRDPDVWIDFLQTLKNICNK